MIRLILTDNLSGVSPDSLTLTVDGIVYDITSTEVSYIPSLGELYFLSEIMYSGGDSVRACLHAVDSPDTCSGNVLDTCWVFYLEPGGPVPRTVRPLNGRISSCDPERIEFTLEDENGIIDTSLHFYVVRSSAPPIQHSLLPLTRLLHISGMVQRCRFLWQGLRIFRQWRFSTRKP